MKNRLIFTLVLLASLFQISFAGDSNSVKHFGLSAVFAYASESYIHDKYSLSDREKVAYSTAIGALPGLAKELNDDKFDNEDMGFNILGSFAGSLLSNYLNNNIFVTLEHNSSKESNKIVAYYKF